MSTDEATPGGQGKETVVHVKGKAAGLLRGQAHVSERSLAGQVRFLILQEDRHQRLLEGSFDGEASDR